MTSFIETVRSTDATMVVAGNHTKIVQSILDFDHASGREKPSILAIISTGRRSVKLFWGDSEILIPVYPDCSSLKEHGVEPHFLLCITSAGSTPRMVDAFFAEFPNALGAHLFAEGVAERDALHMIERYGQTKHIAGASGVGLCVPGSLKLGAIGGIQGQRVAELGNTAGGTAIICSSGGMVNELMYQVTASGGGISFAVSYGGDRFPITSPLQWVLAAEKDEHTHQIVFFGELGGRDEYLIAKAIENGNVSKPFHAYIAGRFESKDENIQFGHAKALAKAEDETAAAKMKVLRLSGAHVYSTFGEFMEMLASLPKDAKQSARARAWITRSESIRPTSFSARRYTHADTSNTFTEAVLQRILQKEHVSHETVDFVDSLFTELIDHGPHVSGAVNTMITTRAGRDMGVSVASGILTIGERFGGAMNNAAIVWFENVSRGTQPTDLVNEYSRKRDLIPGIGHKKYSVYKPDPRVAALLAQAKAAGIVGKHLTFAEDVARETSKKRANLILNVDGAVSALLLDYLIEKEGYSSSALKELIEIEFFNALFIIPRSIGFVGHYLDQKRIDEGLFRLNEDDIYEY
jgi:succinyl-CoA synthetase alpha subunit